MKKIVAALLAVICAFSVFCISVAAKDPIISPEESVKIISGIKGDEKGGKITPPSSEYKPGDDVTFYITPNKGYRIKQVWVNGVAIGPVSQYLFKNIQEDSSIYAEFEKIEEVAPTKPEKRNTGKTSPDTGANLDTVVFCVLGTMFVGGIAAVSVAKKGRKED